MTTPAPPAKGKGGKILGMPRQVAIVGGIALAAGVIWYFVRGKKQASDTSQAQQQDTSGVDYAGEISTLQSEFGDLASEISAMQGGGGSGGGGIGGVNPGGPMGPPGPPGPRGKPGPAWVPPKRPPKPKPKRKPKQGPTARHPRNAPGMQRRVNDHDRDDRGARR